MAPTARGKVDGREPADRSARRAIVALAAAVFGLAFVASALADVGDLTWIDCIEDHNVVTSDCGDDDTAALNGAIAVAVAPLDSSSVYVVGRDDDSVVHFQRDPGTSLLTSPDCVDDNDDAAGQGPDTCGRTSDGLNSPQDIAISPDGTSVYTVSNSDDAVVRFTRNTTNGKLRPRDCVDTPGALGPEPCATTAVGLGDPSSVVVSPDGTSVYVSGFAHDAIVQFKRNTTSGKLTPKGCVDDDIVDGLFEVVCDQTSPGLDGPIALAISADGASLYAASATDDSIVRFDRNTTSGKLTPKGCVEDDDSGASGCGATSGGLDNPSSLAISADGASLYAGSLDDDAVARFSRNTTSGSLKSKGCVMDNDTGLPGECADTADGLQQVTGVAVSPDGQSVYATAQIDSTVVEFTRNAASGALSDPSCIKGVSSEACIVTGVAGLVNPRAVEVSGDGGSLYVAAIGGDSVAAFTREPPPP